MFDNYQQAKLKSFVRPKEGDYFQGTENTLLDKGIAELKIQSPELFHASFETMRKRVFFDEPPRESGYAQIPMAGFIRPLEGWKS
jgi:hypothetical protein